MTILAAIVVLAVGLQAPAAPLTTAQLRARVAALEAENALLQRDVALLTAGCPSATPSRPPRTPPPPVTVLDRHKFDNLYTAGKAMDGARFLSAVGVSPRHWQQLVLAFSTELAIVVDHATTAAEQTLAAQYHMAYLRFTLGAAQAEGRTSHEEGMATMGEASELLEAANAIYLGK